MLYGAVLQAGVSNQLSQRNSLLRDKLGESLVFLSAQVATNKLSLTLLNNGGISLHIVRLWVTNTSSVSGWHQAFSEDAWIQPGSVLMSFGGDTGSYDPANTYLLKVVTGRGNIFQLTYAPSSTLVSTAKGFGWITIDWSSYIYTYSTGGGADQGPLSAWCVIGLSSTSYQFRVKLINHYNQTISLLSWTYLKLQANSGGSQPFFLMASTSQASAPVAYPTDPNSPNLIPLGANPNDQATGGAPVELRFFAATPGGTHSSTLSGVVDYSAVVVIFYKLPTSTGTQTVGQTVAYEGTQLISPSC